MLASNFANMSQTLCPSQQLDTTMTARERKEVYSDYVLETCSMVLDADNFTLQLNAALDQPNPTTHAN